MPQISYRANLASAQFSFTGGLDHGQTVIIGGPDQNFSRQLAAKADQDRSVGIPQVYRVVNAAPIEQGYASLSAAYNSGPLNDANLTTFSTWQGYSNYGFPRWKGIFTELSALNSGQLLMADGGQAYAPRRLITQGIIGGGSATIIPEFTQQISEAYGAPLNIYSINGIQYVFTGRRPTGNSGPYGTWELPVGSLVPTWRPFTGLTSSFIEDATTSNGYHVALVRDLTAANTYTFAWSSLTNPLDFTPSLITGAGSFGIQAARGVPLALLSAASGVYVICANNIVFARYTGNPRFPFALQNIDGSEDLVLMPSQSGIAGQRYQLKFRYTDAYDPVDVRYAAFPSGIFKLTPNQCTPVFSEFDYNIQHIELVAGRYLFAVESGNFYDFMLQRWGNLGQFTSNGMVFTKTAAWSLGLRTQEALTPRSFDSVPFALRPPALTAAFNGSFNGILSEITLGRYQHVRGRMLELQSVDIQGGPTPGLGFNQVFAEASLAGDSVIVSHTPTATQVSGRQVRYYFGTAPVGLNISLRIRGQFNVTSCVLNFNLHGKAMMS